MDGLRYDFLLPTLEAVSLEFRRRITVLRQAAFVVMAMPRAAMPATPVHCHSVSVALSRDILTPACRAMIYH